MGTLRSMPEYPGADAATDAPDRPAAHDSFAVVWDDAFTEYDFERFHPMAPVRLTLTRDLARASGLLDRPGVEVIGTDDATEEQLTADRKSTRLNSSHVAISYAVFCLKKKK